MLATHRDRLLRALFWVVVTAGCGASVAPPGSGDDLTSPTVTAVTPSDGASAVAPGASVSVTFSEAVEAASVNTSSFTLSQSTQLQPVPGTISVAGNTATLTPGGDLLAGTMYTARVNVGVRDLAGNAMSTARTWSFTTALAPLNAPALGAHLLAYKAEGTSTGPVNVPPLNTQTGGSTIVVCVGRGVITDHVPPTDNKGNTYVQLGTARSYTRFPLSGTACYAATNATGGSGHVVSVANSPIHITSETTITIVEIRNGSVVQDVKWNEDLTPPNTSLPVTTTAPAMLLSVWWGDGDVAMQSVTTPSGGFTLIDQLLPPGLIVQASVAVRAVTTPGAYTATWNSLEGAQLWQIAIQ